MDAQFNAAGILKMDEIIAKKPVALDRIPAAVRIHQKDENEEIINFFGLGAAGGVGAGGAF